MRRRDRQVISGTGGRFHRNIQFVLNDKDKYNGYCCRVYLALRGKLVDPCGKGSTDKPILQSILSNDRN